MSRARRAESVSDVDTKPLLDDMVRLASTIGRINLQLPIKSPARAGLKTLTDQMREVATILTNNPDYMSGKPHTMPTAFRRD